MRISSEREATQNVFSDGLGLDKRGGAGRPQSRDSEGGWGRMLESHCGVPEAGLPCGNMPTLAHAVTPSALNVHSVPMTATNSFRWGGGLGAWQGRGRGGIEDIPAIFKL